MKITLGQNDCFRFDPETNAIEIFSNSPDNSSHNALAIIAQDAPSPDKPFYTKHKTSLYLGALCLILVSFFLGRISLNNTRHTQPAQTTYKAMPEESAPAIEPPSRKAPEQTAQLPATSDPFGLN